VAAARLSWAQARPGWQAGWSRSPVSGSNFPRIGLLGVFEPPFLA